MGWHSMALPHPYGSPHPPNGDARLEGALHEYLDTSGVVEMYPF